MLKQSPLTLHVRSARRRAPQSDPEYEIHCRWHLPTSRMPSEWSVWRTYEQFQQFDDQMRSREQSPFAKMMVTVVFASQHPVRMFFRQDRSDQFLDLRRKELDHYLQRIMAFPDVCEFEKAMGSRHLAEFVQADNLWNNAIEAMDRVVDLHRVSTLEEPQRRTSHSSNSSSKRSRGSFMKRRKSGEIKQEIRQQIEQFFGERDLKKYKKRVREWKQDNDRVKASEKLVAFLLDRFGEESASFVVVRQLELCKDHEYDLKEALFLAAEDGGLLGKAPIPLELQRTISWRSNSSSTTTSTVNSSSNFSFGMDTATINSNSNTSSSSKKTIKARKGSCSSSCSSASFSVAPLSSGSCSGAGNSSKNPSLERRKSSNELILAKVKFYAQGDKRKVSSFRKSAKALGTFQMSSEEFVSFVKTSFPDDHANEIVLMVSDAVPHSELKQELKDLVP